MPAETIWISNPERLENQHDFSVAPGATKEEKAPYRADRQRSSDASLKAWKGERLGSDEVITRLFHFKRGRLPFGGTIPPVIANSGIFLREDVLSVMREFDLGSSQAFPVTLFDTTPDNPIGATVWLFNPVNAKKTVDPDLSGLERPRIGATVLNIYHPPHDLPNQHLQIRTFPAAMQGPDVWIDLLFPRSLFFSDRLAKRLIAEGWQTNFDLYPTTLL